MRWIAASALFFLGFAPAMAKADASANFGMVSDYIFRGFFQEEASAFAGFDYAADNGLYGVTWFGEVGQGIEYDLLIGYNGAVGELGWDLSYGAYMYTDDFDDTYKEWNLGLTHSGFTLNLVTGKYDGFGNPLDYSFVSLGYAFDNGFYATLADWGADFDGSYVELGYGFDFNGLDLSVALIGSNDMPVSQEPVKVNESGDVIENARFNIVFGISKSFDLGF